jgi:HSP20 family molecular chaperone IbpA
MNASDGQEGTAMTGDTRTGMQETEKGSVRVATEQTRPGPVYTPAVDIFENDTAITLLADMPGVKAQDLQIDLRESVLTLTGPITKPESSKESDVAREYRTGTFFRQFTLSEKIDQGGIDAKLTDGVLRLEMRKVEKAMPRQITVRTS